MPLIKGIIVGQQKSDNQWRSQNFGLGGAVGRFWLKSLVNIAIYCEYIDF